MQQRRTTSTPPERATVVYDGDCGFCKFWVERWRSITDDRFDWVPFQEATRDYPDLPPSIFEDAVQLIGKDGTVTGGADAVLAVLATSSGWHAPIALAKRIPGLLPVLRWMYAIVARNRVAFSQLTRLLWGSDPSRPTFAVARRVFGLALGIIFIAAFASLAVQVRALFGVNGIVPAAEFLPAAEQYLGSAAYWRVPTIFWAGVSDAALTTACLAGILFGLLLAVGIWPAGSVLVCWALYLSLCSVGSPFLDFQWDALLLETALVAAVYLPWRLRPNWGSIGPVSTLGRLLVVWLLFRLMVESAAVKLASGDPTWAGLRALSHHFETQPLPLWTSWYAHHLPPVIHQAGVVITFSIEFLAPLGIFGPRRVRHCAAWAMIVLQVAILVTGNYAFFNWLTIALCLPLFEDRAWPGAMRQRVPTAPVVSVRRHWPVRIVAVAAIPIILLTGAQLISAFSRKFEWPSPIGTIHSALAPLRSFNSYGLFAMMTTERPEIVVEGSNDGTLWHEYEFKWKPGDVKRRPALVAPHQPRLDWQMWFAALGDVRQNQWFVRFLFSLLRGSPEVLEQLDWNPFPSQPPRYVRAVMYDYRFTKPEDGGTAWWSREGKRLYCPPISLEDQNR